MAHQDQNMSHYRGLRAAPTSTGRVFRVNGNGAISAASNRDPARRDGNGARHTGRIHAGGVPRGAGDRAVRASDSGAFSRTDSAGNRSGSGNGAAAPSRLAFRPRPSEGQRPTSAGSSHPPGPGQSKPLAAAPSPVTGGGVVVNIDGLVLATVDNVSEGVLPRQPWGMSPQDFLDKAKGNILQPLIKYAVDGVDPRSALVRQKRGELNLFIRYLESCHVAYPKGIPYELGNSRYVVMNALRMALHEKLTKNQEYVGEDTQHRVSALLDWIGNSPVMPKKSKNPNRPGSGTSNQASSGGKNASGTWKSNDKPRLLPPPDHPIWGVDGIMHGLCIKDSDSITYCLNPRYNDQKSSAARFGHNGLRVGDWFPFQLSAVFHGAHGSSCGGIYGHQNHGAYSVIITSSYSDLDKDMGETIYYSGSGSHANTDPTAAAAPKIGTIALRKSMRDGNPVRVLRKASKSSPFAPSEGIRYDGLYIVTGFEQIPNRNGGLYERFTLKRIQGQTPLSELANIPSRRQKMELVEVHKRFPKVT
ncbi:E3 ubiquitin-protein ligase UHRF1 [Colletotrichum chlorophyti]|uniref:E3 ubiquitin-protein ligase UHRF1 n=1 Tax=Colletotrichum chlorophyti TaxID=708187 RepID=A0A1Q8RT74_9PEZI|nr:E3 ubiquitin-protein ligase UHRF1 [Colletotrichum chlorophyti]